MSKGNVTEEVKIETHRHAKNTPQVPKPKVNLQTLSTEADEALNNLIGEELEEEHKKQREIDEESDYEDTHQRQVRAKLKEEARVAAEKEKRGEVLANGKISKKIVRPGIEPGKVYKNWPIKTIDGEPVIVLGSRPFWDKSCEWDNGYQDQYEHFLDTDHPNFYNAVYTKIKYVDHEKRVHDAWVVQTDKEKILYIKRP